IGKREVSSIFFAYLSLVIEIADGDTGGTGADGEILCRLERSIAIAQQHRDGVGVIVGDDQVRNLIKVEVADGDGNGTGANAEGSCRLERRIAVAQEHRDGVGRRAGHGEVELAIFVEVVDGQSVRKRSTSGNDQRGP